MIISDQSSGWLFFLAVYSVGGLLCATLLSGDWLGSAGTVLYQGESMWGPAACSSTQGWGCLLCLRACHRWRSDKVEGSWDTGERRDLERSTASKQIILGTVDHIFDSYGCAFLVFEVIFLSLFRVDFHVLILKFFSCSWFSWRSSKRSSRRATRSNSSSSRWDCF